MDPITISGILAAAAGALGSEAVKDAYNSVKSAIKVRRYNKFLFRVERDLVMFFD